MPWSMPPRHDLLQVVVGVVLGSIATALLMATAGTNVVFGIIVVSFTVLPLGVLLTNYICWERETSQQQQQRQREARDEHYWRFEANRSASNKRVRAWTGRHAGRSAR